MTKLHNEALYLECEKLAAQSIIQPAIVPVLHDLLVREVVVDPAANVLTIEGKDLSEAVADWAKKNAWSAPPKAAAPDQSKIELEAIKAAALNGNATAHGKLSKLLGDDYKIWCDANKAAPGKKVEPKVANGHDKDADDIRNSNDNPWSAAGWNITAQGKIVRALGIDKAAAMAKSAGCKLGDVRPNPHHNGG